MTTDYSHVWKLAFGKEQLQKFGPIIDFNIENNVEDSDCRSFLEGLLKEFLALFDEKGIAQVNFPEKPRAEGGFAVCYPNCYLYPVKLHWNDISGKGQLKFRLHYNPQFKSMAHLFRVAKGFEIFLQEKQIQFERVNYKDTFGVNTRNWYA